MLGLNDAKQLDLFEDADDRVIWDREPDALKHVASGERVPVENGGERCRVMLQGRSNDVEITRGPHQLPSVYLAHLKQMAGSAYPAFSPRTSSTTCNA